MQKQIDKTEIEYLRKYKKQRNQESFDIIANFIISKNMKEELNQTFNTLDCDTLKNTFPIDFSFNNNALKNNYLYGKSVYDIITDFEFNKGRCHSTVLAESLCFDNFTWAFANIKNYALLEFDKSLHDENAEGLGSQFVYARELEEIEPAFMHSYLELPGDEIIKSGLVGKASDKIDRNKTYVFDYILKDGIMEKDAFIKTFRPEIYQTFSAEEIKSCGIWQEVKAQAECNEKNFCYNHYLKIYKSACKAEDSMASEFLRNIILNDFQILPTKDDRFKEYYFGISLEQICGKIKIEPPKFFYNNKMQKVESELLNF